MNKSKKLILVALLMMAATFIEGRAFAQTAIERLKSDYPAVMESYAKRLEAQKADYVIAIDVSGSMLNHKNLVEPALSSFIDAIPDGDNLSIIKFGAKADEFGLSGKVDASTKEGFKQSLSKIYERDEKYVHSTNIYAMCEKVLDQMSRTGGNDMKYIFMFTDFIDMSGRQESAYQVLGDRVAGMAKNSIIRAFAMQLPGVGNVGRDIPKVRCVFPSLQTINVENSTQLNSWFEGQKAEISKVRLKDMIRGDFDKWYSENKITTELAIGLNGGLKLNYDVDGEVVPAFVNGFMLTQCEPVSQSNNVEKINIKNDTIYKGRNVSAKIGSLKFFKKNLFQKNTKATVAMTMRPTFITGDKEGEPSFANEIRNLGLETDLLRSSELTAENNFVLGWNIWLVCALLLLLLIFLYYFIKMTVLPHKLKNVAVIVTTTIDKNPYRHPFDNEVSALFGKRGVVVLPQANFVLEVRGKRGFPIFVPRSIVFEIVEKPENGQVFYYINNNNIPSLYSKVKPDDSVRIQQGSISYNFKIKNI